MCFTVQSRLPFVVKPPVCTSVLSVSNQTNHETFKERVSDAGCSARDNAGVTRVQITIESDDGSPEAMPCSKCAW